VNTKTISSFAIKHWPCLLILLAFIGFMSKSLYNYPVSIMALLGLYQFIINPKQILQDSILKTFSLVFLCLWLPLLISFPDAVNQSHSARTVFPYLRFFFAGIFIINELSKEPVRLKFIVASLFYIVLFWCLDATIQFIFNKNLVGFPYQPGHITGMFYPRNTISHICSILSAFSFFYIYMRYDNNKLLIISIIPLFFIILLSGRRAAWIMLALSTFGFFIYTYLNAKNKKQFLQLIGVLSLIVSILLSLTIIFHKPTHHRFKVTLGLFSNNYETIDKATALRLPLWETALNTFKANPINGIGPRGFRYAYQNYSSPNDYWETQTHPHLLILEIMCETGSIGLIGYLILLTLLITSALRTNKLKDVFPFLLPVLVAVFPLNAHMAFYGSIWSSMVWLLIPLYFAKAKLN
jgi:O-antigen ligase